MRRIALLLASVLVFAFGAGIREAQADVTVGVDVFYNDLAPYGDWFEMQDYGWVWTPHNVATDWRPYTRGRWVFSDDDGWLWASDEDFGWATCHYGRWFFDDRYGWVWIPGREWAPAWVAWRSGGGYVGWAPLPPQFRGNVGVGFRVGQVDFDAWIAPRQYVFVPESHFVDSGVYRQVLPPARNVTFVNETRNVTNYGVRQNRLVNRSLSHQEVEQHVGRAVPRVRVVEERATPPRRAEVRGGQVRVFRPAVRNDSAARPPRALAANDVPRVKPHPVEPPIDSKTAHRPERAPTASLRPPNGERPSANLKPGPVELQRQREAGQQRAGASKEALRQQQEGQQQALREKQARQAQELKQKQQLQQERETRQREAQQQAQLQRQQMEQQRQERQKQTVRDTQARQEQELKHKQLQEQQDRAAREREGQRQRQQDQQRLKLQQQQERDHQALRDKQARQQQQLEQQQRKQQARDDQAKRKQQQQQEGKKPRPKPQPTPPPS